MINVLLIEDSAVFVMGLKLALSASPTFGNVDSVTSPGAAVGEVVFNLCETGRMRRRETDPRADFIGGFNFKEEFFFPYEEQ